MYCVSRIIEHCCTYWKAAETTVVIVSLSCALKCSAYLFPVALWLLSVQLLSCEDFRLSVFIWCIVHCLLCLPPRSVSSRPPATCSRSVTALRLLHCLCQGKVYLKMRRSHTIMSSDRVSAPSLLLPPLHPPAPIQLSPPVGVMSPAHLACFRGAIVSAEPIGPLMVLQHRGNIPLFLGVFWVSLTTVRYLSFPVCPSLWSLQTQWTWD